MWKIFKRTTLDQLSHPVVVRYPTTGQAILRLTYQPTRKKQKKKKVDDAGEPAPEDGDIEELSYHEMLLNRESNPGLPRLVGVNDKRKS